MSWGRWFLILFLLAVAVAERFGLVTLRAALLPLLQEQGGLALSEARAGRIAELFATGVACSPLLGLLLGPWVPSRLLLLVGAALSAGSLLLLGVGEPGAVYVGLGAAVLGQGLLRPAVYTCVGQALFRTDAARRHLGLALLLLASNAGAFLAPVGERLARARPGSLHAGLLGPALTIAAGTAALAFLLAFALRTAESEPPEQAPSPGGAFSSLLLGGLPVLLIGLYFALRPEGTRTVLGTAALPLAQTVLLALLAPFYLVLARKDGDSSAVRGLGASLLIAALAGGAMLLGAESRTLAAVEVVLRIAGLLAALFGLSQLTRSLGRRGLVAGVSVWMLLFEFLPQAVSGGLIPATEEVLRGSVLVAAVLGAIALVFSEPLEAFLAARAAPPPPPPPPPAKGAKVKLARGKAAPA
jgi:hypothetical protein